MANEKNLDNLRHSCAHLLAATVLKLYPETKLTIGPAIENGFYYDFDLAEPISEDDFPTIEKEMEKILPTWKEFTHREVSENEAKEIYKHNPYKLELINEIVNRGEKITLYKAGDFEDLCRGGHSENPAKELGAFKLLSTAGAYWRGDEKNKMLTRIYGTAFPTQKELDEYLEMLEEAKKRDHKKLGAQLELFFFDETAPGMPYWLPKGLTIYNTLLEFVREKYTQFGYQEIVTPQLNKKELYETSGHWFHYREDMFISPMSFLRGESKDPFEGTETFGIKPMNCPNAMRVFGMKTRSYNELPLRFGETSLLHRFELSGTLNGLFRTRQFRQDDAHVYLSVDQIESEFKQLMDMIGQMYKPFGLPYRLRFGTRPENFMGEPKDWDVAENSLKSVLEKSEGEYFEAEGEGAFYGPKIDILMKDVLGREWQTGTIQLDFQQPKNFGLKYINSDSEETTPVVFHRAIFGSFERFLGILIEHYAGALPIWLSPVQIAVIPVSDKFNEYGKKIADELEKSGIRVALNESNNTVGAKIREATLQKVPFMCIIGKNEEVKAQEEGVLIGSVRTREGKDLGSVKLPEFIVQLQQDINEKI